MPDFTSPEFDIRIGPSSRPLGCAPVTAYEIPAAVADAARVVIASPRGFVGNRQASQLARVLIGGNVLILEALELTPATIAAGTIDMVRIDGHPDDDVRYYVIAASGR